MSIRLNCLWLLMLGAFWNSSAAPGQQATEIVSPGDSSGRWQGLLVDDVRGVLLNKDLQALEGARKQAVSEKAWYESLVNLKKADYVVALRLAQDAQAQANSDEIQRARTWLELATQDLNRSRAGLRLAEDLLVEREGYLLSAREQQANQALGDWLVQAQVAGQTQNTTVSEFWIGVQCEPAAEISLLVDTAPQPLTVKGGLTVTSVIADSPAVGAGVREQDVILYMNDRPTNQLEELVAVITENQDHEARLTLVRDQRLVTLAITPAKRPVEQTPANVLTELPIVGQVFLNVVPNGYEARIHFSPSASPEFKILQGENTWIVTGANFDELPEETRPFARSIWTAMGVQHHGRTEQTVYGSLLSHQLALEPRLLTYYSQLAQPQPEVNAKLDQLQQQLEEIQKQLDELKK